MQVYIQKSPCSRCDDGFGSAVEDDMCSETRGFRDLKKYYVYSYGCHIKDVKNKGRGRLFYLLFCTVYCRGNIDSKLILHHMEKVLLFNLPS